MSFVPKA